LGPLGVDEIDSSLTQEIHNRTNGNCYILSNLAHAIAKSFGPPITGEVRTSSATPDLVITEQNKLKAVSEQGINDIIPLFLPDDVNFIVSQFDRLGEKFQRILAIASCLGKFPTLFRQFA
jgi:hypothetical protein